MNRLFAKPFKLPPYPIPISPRVVTVNTSPPFFSLLFLPFRFPHAWSFVMSSSPALCIRRYRRRTIEAAVPMNAQAPFHFNSVDSLSPCGIISDFRGCLSETPLLLPLVIQERLVGSLFPPPPLITTALTAFHSLFPPRRAFLLMNLPSFGRFGTPFSTKGRR